MVKFVREIAWMFAAFGIACVVLAMIVYVFEHVT
jgi:hypothetical protein